jgi:hypothetical protein
MSVFGFSQSFFVIIKSTQRQFCIWLYITKKKKMGMPIQHPGTRTASHGVKNVLPPCY